MGTLDNPLSHNLYTYTYNNPIRFIDPNGHDAEDMGRCLKGNEQLYNVIGTGTYTSLSSLNGEVGILEINYDTDYISLEVQAAYGDVWDDPFIYTVGGEKITSGQAEGLVQGIVDESLIKGKFKVKISADMTYVEVMVRKGYEDFDPLKLEDLGKTIGANIWYYEGSISETSDGKVRVQDYSLTNSFIGVSVTDAETTLRDKDFTDRFFDFDKTNYYDDYSHHGRN